MRPERKFEFEMVMPFLFLGFALVAGCGRSSSCTGVGCKQTSLKSSSSSTSAAKQPGVVSDPSTAAPAASAVPDSVQTALSKPLPPLSVTPSAPEQQAPIQVVAPAAPQSQVPAAQSAPADNAASAPLASNTAPAGSASSPGTTGSSSSNGASAGGSPDGASFGGDVAGYLNSKNLVGSSWTTHCFKLSDNDPYFRRRKMELQADQLVYGEMAYGEQDLCESGVLSLGQLQTYSNPLSLDATGALMATSIDGQVQAVTIYDASAHLGYQNAQFYRD